MSIQEDQIELMEYLEERGWKDEEIKVILEKYYDEFTWLYMDDQVNDYLDWIKEQENWE